MAAINDLINQIDDLELRERIKTEVDKLSKQKKFGLVFEDHVPECTALYDVPVHVGSKVALKNKKINDVYVVKSINDDQATCVNTQTKETTEFSLDSLVSIAEFGEAIYPYLKPIDSIENAPDSSLWHTLIEADNYHALQLLEYLYASKVDCIYIDPPYNTGAKDWKYNNDYVDSSDAYRHSKWLSMMEKRLKLAKKLLNPADSVLIVTIDEKEYLHLGCLLEELFPDARMQMVSSEIHHGGTNRKDEFSRINEFIYFLRFGKSSIHKDKVAGSANIPWRSFNRSSWKRSQRPNLFYPIYVNKTTHRVVKIGSSLNKDEGIESIPTIDNCIAVLPFNKDKSEGIWRLSSESASALLEKGYFKVNIKNNKYSFSYLLSGVISDIDNGKIVVEGRDQQGCIIAHYPEGREITPSTQWNNPSHDASQYGSVLLRKFIDDKFTFPKSLYAVKDCLNYFVQENKSAIILDFFAGSGTTLHAVNLLNAEDGGHRRCIMVTNNEVSDEEAKKLKKDGFKPGDPEWERLGIAHYVTWPRTVCSIKGEDINGNPLKGTYLDSERAMADGFKANAAFFKLGFLDKNAVALGRQFKELLPVLWMKTGCVGLCPKIEEESLPSMLILPENAFAVLIDEHAFPEFMTKVNDEDRIKQVFIVTDSTSGYREMISHLSIKKSYQLYRDYLDNFRINTGR